MASVSASAANGFNPTLSVSTCKPQASVPPIANCSCYKQQICAVFETCFVCGSIFTELDKTTISTRAPPRKRRDGDSSSCLHGDVSSGVSGLSAPPAAASSYMVQMLLTGIDTCQQHPTESQGTLTPLTSQPPLPSSNPPHPPTRGLSHTSRTHLDTG